FAVATNDVTSAGGLEHLGDGDTCGTGADDEDFDLAHLFLEQLQRVQRGGENDNGGAVLVVVEHGNVKFLLEAVFDLETARRADVFEVDAAEPGGDPF